MAPPPPPMPEMLNELVEEILLRFPPDDPASLVRAALVCKLWCRIVSAAAFRRRYRKFHRTQPLLGVLCWGEGGAGDARPSSRFVPMSSFHPVHPVRHGWRAIDARQGRVLLECWPSLARPLKTKFIVWDPVTNKQRKLPSVPIGRHMFKSIWDLWTAAVICAAGGNCNHRYCNRESFMVVFVGIVRPKTICSSIYSSKTGAWSEKTFTFIEALDTYEKFKSAPCALIGNALYFLLHSNRGIIKYDLTTQKVSVIDMPPKFIWWQHIVLMTMKDGTLGFATVDLCGLYVNLWSRVVGPDGDASFAQCGIINLPKALNACGGSPRLSGFAHDVGVLFIWTFYGLYSMDIKSEQVRKVPNTMYCTRHEYVVPYLNFHTPALRAAST